MYDQKAYNKITSKIIADPRTGCWLWTGGAFLKRKYAAHRYGYVSIKVDGVWRTRTTHRCMWYAVHGWPAKGMEVCHKCDVPLCCNPDHLFLGTHQENMQDSKIKGRHFLNAKTVCKRGHPLSGDNLSVDKNGCRHCIACEIYRTRVKAGWPEHLALTLPVGPIGFVPPEVEAYRQQKRLEAPTT